MTKSAKPTDREDYQTVPRPIAAMAKDFPDRHVIALHRHPRAQLIFASAGVMTVTTPDGAWVVPTQRALWVPAGTDHEIRMSGRVAMRTLYIRGDAVKGLAGQCGVVTVSPLLRELILRAVDLPLLYDETGSGGRIMAVIIDEIHALPALPLHLPLPSDRRLRRICESISRDPAIDLTLDQWGHRLGASGRTLARRFQIECGMTFGGWRQQARLLEALARLASGLSVTAVALDLGYESPSAFVSMFRRALGTTPGRYFR